MKKTGCLIVFIFVVLTIAIVAWYVPYRAASTFGAPSDALDAWGKWNYSARVLWAENLLNAPLDIFGAEQTFIVEPGESVYSIAARLESQNLVADADVFRDFLVYSGLDISIQSGEYLLNPGMSPVQIAGRLQDATPTQITFYVLSGWRMEEIAAALPTSGLSISTDEFLAVASSPPSGLDFVPDFASSEGFLFPDAYVLPRQINARDFVAELSRNFALHLSNDLREGFTRQGLTIYQAVTLASIIQREAVVEDEQPLIASVFLNRLAIGMKLESDPTVQYALGYNTLQSTWWTNPLTLTDLKFDSPYNTYVYPGLPPGPIANPNLGALQAVAYPAQTPYYFFRALCDGSGRHAFAETFEQHLENGCP